MARCRQIRDERQNRTQPAPKTWVTVWESELAEARVRACAHVGSESRPGALTSAPPAGVKWRSFISILQMTKLRQTEAESQQLLGIVQGRTQGPLTTS